MSDYALSALAGLSLQRVGFRATPIPLTNDDRMRAFNAMRPVTFGNTRFTPARLCLDPQSPQAVSGPYDPDPPSPEEVAEAYQFKYGV